MAERCGAARIDGSPCESTIVLADGKCYSHSPTTTEDRREARARGGAGTSNVARIRRAVGRSRLGPVLDQLEAALRECHDGSLSAARAAAMASVSRAMVAVVEVVELEERLAALERQTA